MSEGSHVLSRPRDAQAAVDARNARYKSTASKYSQRKESIEVDSRELGNRLGAAEKAVEKFVSKRIQPAVQKVSSFYISIPERTKEEMQVQEQGINARMRFLSSRKQGGSTWEQGFAQCQDKTHSKQ